MNRLIHILVSFILALSLFLLTAGAAQAAGRLPLDASHENSTAAGTVYIASSASSLGIFLLLTAIVLVVCFFLWLILEQQRRKKEQQRE